MIRVAQIGIDILVEGNTDGYTLAETVKNALKSKGFIVVGSLFTDDMTEAYKSTNPDLFN